MSLLQQRQDAAIEIVQRHKVFSVVCLQKYGKRAAFTLHTKFDLNLDELLEHAQMLEEKREKEVLIVLGHLDLINQQNHEIEFPYGKTFSWTNQSLEKFLLLTEKVKDFKGANGIENFEVYRLK